MMFGRKKRTMPQDGYESKKRQSDSADHMLKKVVEQSHQQAIDLTNLANELLEEVEAK